MGGVVSANTISRQELQSEIEALHQQAETASIEYRDTLMKIEGALQFAHHLLTQVDATEHQTLDKGF